MEDETGLKQLLILSVITLFCFIFVPGIKNIGTMSVAQIGEIIIAKNNNSINENFPTQHEQVIQKETPVKTDSSKYTTETIPDELNLFLSQYGYKAKAEQGKKLVIFANFPNSNDDEKDERVRYMRAYATNEAWAKKYSFIEAKYDENHIKFDTNDDFKRFLTFGKYCSYFCIVDYNKNTVFSGEKTANSQYIYDVLSHFYK